MPPILTILLILLLQLEMGILFVKERNFLEETNFFVKDSVSRSQKKNDFIRSQE